jgi:hypothetical protein
VKYATEMASAVMIYIPRSMTFGTGVQAVLKFCLRKFRGCYVDIRDSRDL